MKTHKGLRRGKVCQSIALLRQRKYSIRREKERRTLHAVEERKYSRDEGEGRETERQSLESERAIASGVGL
jgi:hypothetical protein